MNGEHTIAMWHNGEGWNGYGTIGGPTTKQRSLAVVAFAFVRSDTRIHVLSFEAHVTEDVARFFAVAYYEGKGKTIDLNDVPHERFTAVQLGNLFT